MPRGTGGSVVEGVGLGVLVADAVDVVDGVGDMLGSLQVAEAASGDWVSTKLTEGAA
jgi:hypothetical protein